MITASPLSLEDLHAIATETWTTVLGLAVAADECEPEGDLLLSCVQIIGQDTRFAVVLTASVDLARDLTAAMLQMAASEIGEQDRNDAFGEIANILGGCVKSRIRDKCSLSLPVVVHGAGVSVSYPRSTVCLRSSYSCAAKPFTITLYRQE